LVYKSITQAECEIFEYIQIIDRKLTELQMFNNWPNTASYFWTFPKPFPSAHCTCWKKTRELNCGLLQLRVIALSGVIFQGWNHAFRWNNTWWKA